MLYHKPFYCHVIAKCCHLDIAKCVAIKITAHKDPNERSLQTHCYIASDESVSRVPPIDWRTGWIDRETAGREEKYRGNKWYLYSEHQITYLHESKFLKKINNCLRM